MDFPARVLLRKNASTPAMITAAMKTTLIVDRPRPWAMSTSGWGVRPVAESATRSTAGSIPMRMPTVARVTMSAFSRRTTMRKPLTRLRRTDTPRAPSTNARRSCRCPRSGRRSRADRNDGGDRQVDRPGHHDQHLTERGNREHARQRGHQRDGGTAEGVRRKTAAPMTTSSNAAQRGPVTGRPPVLQIGQALVTAVAPRRRSRDRVVDSHGSAPPASAGFDVRGGGRGRRFVLPLAVPSSSAELSIPILWDCVNSWATDCCGCFAALLLRPVPPIRPAAARWPSSHRGLPRRDLLADLGGRVSRCDYGIGRGPRADPSAGATNGPALTSALGKPSPALRRTRCYAPASRYRPAARARWVASSITRSRVGVADACYRGKVEGDAEQGVDLHRPTGQQVLRDALQVARRRQLGQALGGVAGVAAEGVSDGRDPPGHCLGGGEDGRLVEDLLHG